MTRIAGALPLLALWAVPLLAALVMAIAAAASSAAWTALLVHPQLWPALGLSLWTGTAATCLAFICALIISAGFYRSPAWPWLQPLAATGMALPHLAFAIGFGILIMPSGLVARLGVGGDTPPNWITTQDPLGLSLTIALALKEIPFLVAMIWSLLAQGDTAAHLEGQWRAARSLGHGAGSTWLRVVQPQIVRRMTWPLLIVFSYGASVVDMALVMGPTQPPPLAVIIWNDLNHGTAANNARGIAGAILLTLAIGSLAALSLLALRALGVAARPLLSAGPSPRPAPRFIAAASVGAAVLIYSAVLMLLTLLSFAPRWPYPAILPPALSLSSWQMLLTSSPALWLSLGLAAASSIMALVLVVLWFETQPRSRDRWLLVLAAASLALPQVLIAAGQYDVLLRLGLTGDIIGLFLVHLAPVIAYAAIVLAAPYRSFDQRYIAAARSLSAGPWRRWRLVKGPLLRVPLLTAAAVGFSVSMVQFVPAQLIAAGRFETLPMAAVTLTSGGSRSLSAAFALALALPPLLVFLAAAIAGRTRWR